MTNIELFTLLFWIFLVIMILGFGLAVLTFFVYRIPQVFSLMTGRMQKKTVEKIRAGDYIKNEGSDNAAPLSQDLLSNYTGGLTENTSPVDNLSASVSPAYGVSDETTALNTDASETSVLQQNAEETSVLQQNAGRRDTNVPDEPLTSVLNPHVPGSQINPGDCNDYETGMTTALNSTPSPLFANVEHTMIIHSDEII